MNLIKRITDKLRRKPLLVKPVVSNSNCKNCDLLRINKYAKYRYENWKCDISGNYITDIEHWTCSAFTERVCHCHEPRPYCC